MPVEVPTQDEFAAAVLDLQSQVDVLTGLVEDLETRVVALEQGGTTPPEPEPEPEPEPVGAVIVHMNGADFVYDPAAGVDLGDYRDPDGRFTMTCIRVRRDDCPLAVDFRSTGPAWRSIVFEYSNCLVGGLANLAYSVTIEDETIEIASHYANASWRWQSASWPHPLTPLATLYEKKLLPRHDGALALGRAGTLSNITSAPPLSLCGFTPDMAGTGGRADIGVVTGWQAEWMCLQNEAMRDTVILQGEAAFCWRFRDVQTEAIIDAIRQYPRASLHYGNGPSGNPQVWYGTGPRPGLDAAHCPSCYYVPFLLTGDPYFLEWHQGETMYCFMEIPRNPNTVVGSEQVRGVAWSLRCLLNAVQATPDEVPRWLLPKSIFADELERQRGLLQARQGDGWSYRTFAHIIDSIYRWQHAWWQHDYATAIAAWASMVDDRWAQQRDWMVEGVNGRSDPDSGWCPGYATSYWTNTTNRNDYYPEGSFKSWAEAWDYNSQNVYTDTPGGTCPTLEERLKLNTTYDYFSAMMDALRLAKQAGSAPAGPVLDRLTDAWNQGLVQYGYTEYKYCASP